MGIIVDLVILAIMVLSIFIGYKKGLIKCAVNILSFFVALLVVILLTNPVSNLIIKNTQIDDNLKTTIMGKLDFNDEDMVQLDEENSDVPEVVRKYINDIVKNTSEQTTGFKDVVAENISHLIINIAVAIILFVATKLILIFVKVLADIIGKIPLIRQFNEIGGAIYGVASGIVRIYLILALISIIVPLLTNTEIVSAINSSTIGKFMYNNNLLLKIIL